MRRRRGPVPRWRCAWPDCPCYGWQLVTTSEELDRDGFPTVAFERHYAERHREKEAA